ncbi:MAG: MBL fold metallo-hydrolase [Clostridia bacterium]|nr:MBL fold metallo-hydrolase [Clostridia bacterium]
MKIYHLTTGPLRVNTYFLVNEEKKTAIVIDSGENYNKVKETEKNLGVKIKAVLLTHAHFDHSGNAKKLQDDGAKIYISKIDSDKLLNEDNLSSRFGRKFNYLIADKTFSDNEVLEIEDIKIKVLLTPGHTDGSATFIIDDMLFTGDTLFCESVGRTDFVSGNREDLINSVKRLFNLKGDYQVYPGHEEFTTLSHEREFNILKEFE